MIRKFQIQKEIDIACQVKQNPKKNLGIYKLKIKKQTKYT